MKSFINLFIEDLLSEGTDLSEACVVFPSRRAGVIFKKKLSGYIDKPVWLPSVYSADDFISGLSPYQATDSTHLLLELYSVYAGYFTGTTFDKFLPWGEILLQDFNEVDLQLADAGKIFSHIISLREIDTLVGVNEEETQRIKEFWKLFSDQEVTGLRKAFLDNWRFLPLIYKEFNLRLKKKGLAYSGMASRYVAENIAGGLIKIPWNKIYFAGFYALSNAEKSIINYLVKKGIAFVYRDADSYYTEDKKQEAGKYFRKEQSDTNFKWLFNYYKSEDRTIHLTGIPLQVGQAKYAGVLIGDLQKSEFSYDDTVLVLPDERLLMPVLYALPADTGPVNVTMGYPLKGSLTDQLCRTLKNLWERREDRSGFFKQDLQSLFENRLIQSLQPFPANEILFLLNKEKRPYLDPLFFDGKDLHPVFQKIFSFRPGKENLPDSLSQILGEILQHDPKRDSFISRFDSGILNFFYGELKKLSRLLSDYTPILQQAPAASWNLVLELLNTLRVPFTGEPVYGLQVMGFLETRNLDFDNLIILSVNEQVLPGTSAGNSYIPYAIRKAYGLPTYEDQDAIYAYHFYRLLQRAKKTWLIYDTEPNGLSGGEMSRYLLQLVHELKKYAGEKLTLTHELVGTGIPLVPIRDLFITKNTAIQKTIQELFFGAVDKKKKWSATAFSTYITCKLQFYFKYIAGISEPDEMRAEIDPAVLGNIIHDVMEQFYTGHQMLTPEVLKEFLPEAETAVERAIRLEFPSRPGKLTGKNSLLKKVMTDLIKKIITHDISEAPLTIHGLEIMMECEMGTPPGTVSLYGKIDRIDEHDGMIRIIDYKTGKDEIPKKFNMEKLFSDPGLKASFQLMLYAMLYRKQHAGNSVKAGIYRLRSISQGIDFLNEGMEISESQLLEFEERLRHLILEIVNPPSGFIQTIDTKSCVWCAYRDICNR